MSVYYNPKESPERRLLRGLIFFIIGLLIGLFITLTGSAKAQEKPPSIQGLQVGEKLPEWVWKQSLKVVNHPAGKTQVPMEGFRGKAILLDFWATWCSSCIIAMRDKHALLKQFKERLVVLPVTSESTEKAEGFLKQNPALKDLHLFSVAGDCIFENLFPHRGIPHYVWIDSSGVVRAFTSAHQITAENMSAFLDSRDSKIDLKIDLDPHRPLFLSKAHDPALFSFYSLLLKGNYDGLPSGSHLRKTNGIIHGRAFTNSPLLSIYTAIGMELFKERAEVFSEKRVIFNSANPAELTLNKLDSSGSTFRTDNLYNYELIVPASDAAKLYHYMLEDLNRYTAYNAVLEQRTMDCFVLVKLKGPNKIKTGGGKPVNTLFYNSPAQIRNLPISSLVKRLNGESAIPLPVIDETGYEGHVDLSLSGALSIPQLQKELHLVNLDLIPTRRALLMLVISDKSASTSLPQNSSINN